jgi:hypothetical protein
MPRARTYPRDMAPSPFATILEALVHRMPGAIGAVLVDFEGETVDYHAPRLEPFEVKVHAAEWQVFARRLTEMPGLANTEHVGVTIRSARRSFFIRPLPDGYALIVVLSRGAGFASTTRAVAVAERQIFAEAAWRYARAKWFLADVHADGAHKPLGIRTDRTYWKATVLGTIFGLRRRERGYQVRLDTGRELTLVRESSGTWYTDERLVSNETPERDTRENSRQAEQGVLLREIAASVRASQPRN